MLTWWNSIESVSKFYTIMQFCILFFGLLTLVASGLSLKASNRISTLQKEKDQSTESRIQETEHKSKLLSDELSKSKNEITRLTKETVLLKNKVQDRKLNTNGVNSFKESLKKYAGIELNISAIGGNNEAMSFARELFDILRDTGFSIRSYPGAIISPDTWSGIIVEIPETFKKEVGDDFAMAFESIGFPIKVVPCKPEVVSIKIGEKL
ncbi:MAG: hypothetical protein GF401_00005 [Chitinivibrionales bacterium]|nr:hypothetical protein [Chitinivibrionales bacterium]